MVLLWPLVVEDDIHENSLMLTSVLVGYYLFRVELTFLLDSN